MTERSIELAHVEVAPDVFNMLLEKFERHESIVVRMNGFVAEWQIVELSAETKRLTCKFQRTVEWERQT